MVAVPRDMVEAASAVTAEELTRGGAGGRAEPSRRHSRGDVRAEQQLARGAPPVATAREPLGRAALPGRQRRTRLLPPRDRRRCPPLPSLTPPPRRGDPATRSGGGDAGGGGGLVPAGPAPAALVRLLAHLDGIGQYRGLRTLEPCCRQGNGNHRTNLGIADLV